MRLGFFAQIIHVNVAVVVAFHQNDFCAGHSGAGRVGAVRRGGNEHYISASFSFIVLKGADDAHAGELALGAGIGLKGRRCKSGYFVQIVGQLFNNLIIARRLFRRNERMQIGEFRPAQRHHRRRRVQLHGTGAEGRHGCGQGQVLFFQRFDIAHHLRLGMKSVEHRMLQIAAFALHAFGRMN